MGRSPLYEHPFFNGCTAAAVDAITALGEIVDYPPGSEVLRFGEPAEHLFVLCSGVARVLIPGPDGMRFVAKIFVAPAVFGEMETLSRTTFIESVEAARACRILRLSTEALRRVFDAHPQVTKNLLVDVCRRFRATAVHSGFSATRSVEARLANLLLAYLRAFGTQVAGGVQIVFDDLTLLELASGIGANEKSVRRAIKTWAEAGWVLRRGKHIIVGNRDALQELAGTDAPQLDYRWTA